MLAVSMLGRKGATSHVLRQIALFSTGGATSHLIINAVGRDRLGIVSDITGMVISSGGNVGQSQAAKLGSHFSLMMSVSVPNEQLDGLKGQLMMMPDMNAAVFETDAEEALTLTPINGYTGYFQLEGADNPGIVHKITSAMTKHGLSIDKMETYTEIAPHGGTCLFNMNGMATAAAPLASGFDIEKIKDELEDLGQSLNCDVVLHDVDNDDDGDRVTAL